MQKLKIAKEVQYFLQSFGKKPKQEKNLSVQKKKRWQIKTANRNSEIVESRVMEFHEFSYVRFVENAMFYPILEREEST